jgi:hypothetical protein
MPGEYPRRSTISGGDGQFKAPFNPHSPTPGRPDITTVDGMASAFVGCVQCHGSKVGLEGRDGSSINVDDLKPGPDGKPTDLAAMAKIIKTADGRPKFHTSTWPNTGIGRMNLDGSLGSCSACHSRHDFSPRRARQPENCGKCHLGPDHPQRSTTSRSTASFRDLRAHGSRSGGLGKDYSQRRRARHATCRDTCAPTAK